MTYLLLAVSLALSAIAISEYVSRFGLSFRRVESPSGGSGVTRIGLSKFPDAILFEYALRLAGLHSRGFDFLYLPWASLDDLLEEQKIDVAYMNFHDAARLQYKLPGKIQHLKTPLVEYFGFAIIARVESHFPKFVEAFEGILEANWRGPSILREEYKRTAAAEVLRSLEGRTVIAGSDTDHIRSVNEFQQSLLGKLVLNIDPNCPSDPDEAYAYFERGNGALFVGGLTQRLRARRSALATVELVAHDDCPSAMQPERNTLAVRNEGDHGVHNKDLLYRLQATWFSSLRTILKNRDAHRDGFLELLNDRSEGEALYLAEDVDEIFDRWFKFPGMGDRGGSSDVRLHDAATSVRPKIVALPSRGK